MSATGKPRRPKGPSIRFAIFNGFVDESLASLSRAEIAVWLILYRDGKSPQWTARASLDDIARRAGINRQTAHRAVASLTRRKMLRVIERGRLNGGPSSYIVFPRPME